MPQLPSAVVQQGVSVQKKSSSIMMLIGIYSKEKRYSSEYIANYANVYVLDSGKPGGTAEGVEAAVRVGIPVIRVSPSGEAPSSTPTTPRKSSAAFSTPGTTRGARNHSP